MNKRKLLVVLLSVATMYGASAQKFKPAPDFLKGKTEINVVFDYSKVIYDKDPQAKYHKEKGKKWVEEWEGTRRENNAMTFIKDANEELKGAANVDVYPKAEYTLIVCVLNCDFGAYAGPMSVPAKLQCTINVVKTGTTTVLASTTLKVAQSSYTTMATPIDFDRMYLAFGEMGEKVGELLYKILK
jgi:hypothetical protein